MDKINNQIAKQDYQTWLSEEGETKISFCNFSEMNKSLGGGVEKGSLNIIVGESGFGKSNLAISMALDLALWGGGLKILFVSAEMSRGKVIPRVCANLIDETINSVVYNKHNAPEKLHLAYEMVEHLPIYFNYKSNIDEIYEDIIQMSEEQNIKYIFIDHLLELTANNMNQNESVHFKYLADIIQKIMEKGITVFVVHQFKNPKEKDDIYGNRDKSEIYQGGWLVKRASNIFYAYRNKKQEETYRQLNQANDKQTASPAYLKLLKARDGFENAVFDLQYWTHKGKMIIKYD